MARTIIRACDLCSASDGTNDEAGKPVTVRNTTVVGAAKDAGRKDLCNACRYKILITAGYTDEQASAIIAEHDKEKTRERKPKADGTGAENAPANAPDGPQTDDGGAGDGAPTPEPEAPPAAVNGATKGTKAKAGANA